MFHSSIRILVGLQKGSGEGSDPVSLEGLGRNLVTDCVCPDEQTSLPPSPFPQLAAVASWPPQKRGTDQGIHRLAVFTVEPALPSPPPPLADCWRTLADFGGLWRIGMADWRTGGLADFGGLSSGGLWRTLMHSGGLDSRSMQACPVCLASFPARA